MNAHKMRYRIIAQYKGNGIALNASNQILFSRKTYEGNHETKYYLVSGAEEALLPSSLIPKLISDVGQIIGYRDEAVVIFEQGQFIELGQGEVYDCNSQGLIVGSTKQGEKIFPCCWDSNGIKWIGDEPGVATAINDLGDILIVETTDFCEYFYNEEEPFEVVTPQACSFCLSHGEKVPLLGLEGQASRVKAMDIDNDRKIVGYSLHSSPEIEAHFGSEYGIPYFGGAAGHKAILWREFCPTEVQQPKYSYGTTAMLLGPTETILGYFATGVSDLPTCTYADLADEAFWSRGGASLPFDSVIWGTYYMSCFHGINPSGNILASNPSCQELVLFAEVQTGEEDYLAWQKGIADRIRNISSPKSNVMEGENRLMSAWSKLRRKSK